jgi:farnesyl diphosphate synthase/geranylgeranyl diphosphate synthase type II
MAEVAAPDFAADRAAVQAALAAAAARYVPRVGGTVGAAIDYALAGEGKRLRAILFLCAYRAAGGRGDAAPLAAAIEIVHAYSLVHDDLPCMDDDEMRRGRPTVHKVHGVAAATAAGFAMVPLAARAAFDGAEVVGLPPERAARVVGMLMAASGAAGMIGGQLLDLEGEGLALSLDQLERIHRLKTGALIAVAVRLGGEAARAPLALLDAFDRYGRAIGLAFQIADDVLDVTATTDQLGKTAGRDLDLRKSTYPALLGVDGARARAIGLVDDAVATLAGAGALTAELETLARFSVERSS